MYLLRAGTRLLVVVRYSGTIAVFIQGARRPHSLPAVHTYAFTLISNCTR